MVTVEHNVYFDESATVDHLEGEDLVIVEVPPAAPTPAVSMACPPPPPPPNDPPCQPHIQKPSQHVQDLMHSIGITSNRQMDPKLTQGIQAPTLPTMDEPTPAIMGPAELEGEGISEQIMAILEDELLNLDEELVMLTETAEAEMLEPSSLTKAKHHLDWPDWEEASAEELSTLHEAGTWELVEPLPGANIVGSKWVFRAKKNSKGNIVCKKARLVAQGFSQIPGINYFDTYALVAHLASIQMILALAVHKGMEIHQIDIKGAYLNGKLNGNEIIYM